MKNKDKLNQFVFHTAPVRGEIIKLSETFKAISSQHAYPPALKKLLGEALCVAAMMSAMIKHDGRLTLQFRGKGALTLLAVQCNQKLELRGVAKWTGACTEHDLQQAFHDGMLSVVLDLSSDQKNYQGIIEWKGTTLAEAVEEYFTKSEQIKTKIWLSTDEDNAAGLLLQAMPDNELGENWQRVIAETDMLSPEMLLNQEIESLLTAVYPTDDIQLFTPRDVAFHCGCSRERSKNSIFILGEEEAQAELNDHHSIVVTCDFCNTEYLFTKDDVAEIFKGAEQLH